tara:strand:+ start:215 stop:577 length:363 start_codon:yes stop_codon:yes gene_type:complete
MATLKPTLTLTSSDASSDSLNFTVTDSLTVTAPSVNLSRLSIGTSSPTVIIASSVSSHQFTYLMNTDSSNIITVSTDAGAAYCTLNPGEFAFLPVKGTVGLEVQANGSACVLEYAYWARS